MRCLTVKLASHTFVALNKSCVGRSRLPHLLALFSPSSSFHPFVSACQVKTRLSRETARSLLTRTALPTAPVMFDLRGLISIKPSPGACQRGRSLLSGRVPFYRYKSANFSCFTPNYNRKLSTNSCKTSELFQDSEIKLIFTAGANVLEPSGASPAAPPHAAITPQAVKLKL